MNPDVMTADHALAGHPRKAVLHPTVSHRTGLRLAAAYQPRRWLANLAFGAVVALGAIGAALPTHAQTRLSNAAYASAAPLFKQIDAAFAADHKKQTGRDVRVETKTGSDAAQVQALRDGLAADVVVLSDPLQIDALASADLVLPDWRTKYPNQAAPWGTTIAFVVRADNPKHIKDWPDLARAGVRVSMPDPALDATGRFAWLGGWAAQRKTGRTEAQTAQYAAGLLKNAAPLAASFDAAAQAFRESDRADVLITLESALPAWREAMGSTAFEVIRPRIGLFIDHPVAVVESVARKKGTGELAKAYLNFLFTPAVQAMATAQGLRVAAPSTAPQAGRSAPVGRNKKPVDNEGTRLLTIDEAFGTLGSAEQSQFSADGWLPRLRASTVTR